MANREGNLVGTIAIAAVVVAAAVALVRATYDFSHERIEANERARVVARLNSVLSPDLRNRDLTTTRITITNAPQLRGEEPVDVFVLTEAGSATPVATVFTTVAPHGYNAAIDLLVGVTPSATVMGVRAVRHRETPGLGDAIEAAKSDWIDQFAGTSIGAPPRALWAVDQDDGAFDSIAGATVTSRAVVAAVRDTLLYFEQHRDELYARAAAAAADADDE
jgi:electron transport complex protein RnfG